MAKLQRSPQRILDRNGRVRLAYRGLAQTPWEDLYHWLLALFWPQFMGLMALLYGVANSLFALAYLAGGDGIHNARPGSFSDAFFFSVQTLASIGYGATYPQTFYAHLVVTVEAFVGLLGLAIATGLIFSRFSRPTAKILFSQVAVIALHEGIPTLMFRMANQRGNQIAEARLWVTLARSEITAEEQFMRRFYDLTLVRQQNPIFALTWTAMHPINQDSPLYGVTPTSLAEQEAEIVVSLAGLDETFSQTIHARHSFTAPEVLWNHRFVDILLRSPQGQRYIDFTQFHEVTAV